MKKKLGLENFKKFGVNSLYSQFIRENRFLVWRSICGMCGFFVNFAKEVGIECYFDFSLLCSLYRELARKYILQYGGYDVYLAVKNTTLLKKQGVVVSQQAWYFQKRCGINLTSILESVPL